MEDSKLKVADLFAGCGGLSLGLQMAGMEPALAVERSPMAAQTLHRNFHGRGQTWDEDQWEARLATRHPLHRQLSEGGTVVADILEVVDPEQRKNTRSLENLGVDVVAGGPPCQGFSLAGRRDPADVRNGLPWAFLDFVRHTRPDGVVVENVAGIRHAFKKAGAEAPFDALAIALSKTEPGYVVQPIEVNAKHFGVPQNRPRMMLVAMKASLASHWPARAGVLPFWRSSDEAEGNGLHPAPSPLIPVVTHKDGDYIRAGEALADLGHDDYAWPAGSDLYDSDQGRYARSMRHSAGGWNEDLLNHRHRRHSRLVEDRFKLYQFLREHGGRTRVLRLAAEWDHFSPHVRHLLAPHLPDAPVPETLSRYGATLAEVVFRLRTRKHSQRVVDPSEPAPTVMTLPDDLVHATEPRIHTVRELARFQSFPDWFEFCSRETTGGPRRRHDVPQFSQVGNAVPPQLAKAVGIALREAIRAARTA